MTPNQLINAVQPKPMPFDLIRIGNGKDGSYLVPDDLGGIEACFSPGVNNYKYFEDYLAINFGIKSHMCDYSSDLCKFSTPIIDGLQTFEKKWLDVNGADDSISLDDWVRRCSDEINSDLILQIDIEGAEFRNLNSADDDLLKRFRIIVIEVHGFAKLLSDSENEVQILINRLTKFHDVVHATANNCCGEYLDMRFGINLPNVIEMTFLRRDRIVNGSGLLRYPILPHSLDINNTGDRPIFLNEKWLNGPECRLDDKKIDQELNNFDLNFYKKRYELLSYASKNFFKVHAHNKNSEKSEVMYSSDLALGKSYFTNAGQVGVVSRKSPYFFHTSTIGIPSITIDLSGDFAISGFEIVNRTDTCFERADAISYIIHLEKDYCVADVILIDVQGEFLNGSKTCFVNFPTVFARYLTIISLKPEPLHFSSIRIFPPCMAR